MGQQPLTQTGRVTEHRIDRLIGVYHADGGLFGELRYVWNKLRGQHCELCDLTHAGVRRRPEWDAAASELGVPFDLVHLNERNEDVARVSEGRTPCVLAEVDGDVRVLLGRDDLAAVGTDLGRFSAAVFRAADAAQLRLG